MNLFVDQTPQLSLQHFPGEHALFTCSLPGSANPDTRCNLYFGEASDPVLTTTIKSERRKNNQWFCLFTVTADDLLRRLHSVQQSDVSCDYSLGSEPKSLSTRSDPYRPPGMKTRIQCNNCTVGDTKLPLKLMNVSK